MALLHMTLLRLFNQSTGHICASAVVWEGVPASASDVLYDRIRNIVGQMGVPTLRKCASNDQKTCAWARLVEMDFTCSAL